MANANPVEPQCADTDGTIPQRWEKYTAEEHATWDSLLARRCALLPGRATPEFLEGLDVLRLSRSGIPHFEGSNERLTTATESNAVLPTDHVHVQGTQADGA